MDFETFFPTLIKMITEFSLKILKSHDEVQNAITALRHCQYFIRKFDDDPQFAKYNELKSLVYNYLACCYRRTGNLQQSLANI